MEIVYFLTKVTRLDQRFLDEFIRLCFDQCLENQEKSATRIKTIITFVIELSEKKQFDPTNRIEIWLMYCSEFKKTRGVKEFLAYLTNFAANSKAK